MKLSVTMIVAAGVIWSLVENASSLKRIHVRTMGKYSMELTESESCLDAEPNKLVKISMSRANRTTVFIIFAFAPEFPPFDQGTAKISVSVWGNGGWKPNFYNYEVKNPCGFLLENFKDIVIYGDGPSKLVCPFPGGKHTCYVPNRFNVVPTIPMVPYGKYKFRVHFHTPDGLHLACCNFIAITQQAE